MSKKKKKNLEKRVKELEKRLEELEQKNKQNTIDSALLISIIQGVISIIRIIIE